MAGLPGGRCGLRPGLGHEIQWRSVCACRVGRSSVAPRRRPSVAKDRGSSAAGRRYCCGRGCPARVSVFPVGTGAIPRTCPLPIVQPGLCPARNVTLVVDCARLGVGGAHSWRTPIGGRRWGPRTARPCGLARPGRDRACFRLYRVVDEGEPALSAALSGDSHRPGDTVWLMSNLDCHVHPLGCCLDWPSLH